MAGVTEIHREDAGTSERNKGCSSDCRSAPDPGCGLAEKSTRYRSMKPLPATRNLRVKKR